MNKKQMKQLDIEFVDLSQLKKQEALEDDAKQAKDSRNLLMPGPCA